VTTKNGKEEYKERADIIVIFHNNYGVSVIAVAEQTHESTTLCVLIDRMRSSVTRSGRFLRDFVFLRQTETKL
jgi:hypothetical protein